MINFNGDSIWNLKPIDVSSVKTQVFGLLIEGEEIVAAFRTIRDQLVFTNKRIISIDVQGLTGLKKSFAIMPYSRVQFFTIQTPGFAGPEGDVIALTDCGLNPEPTAEELASIAIAACDNVSALMDWEPRCAFISYSTDGSGESESARG